MSKYPRPVVGSKYGNRPLIEVPAVSIPRGSRSAGDIAPIQYNQQPYSAQQPTYMNPSSYQTLQQQPYMPQYVSPAPTSQYVPPAPMLQQQHIPTIPRPVPLKPQQPISDWSNIANNSNFVPYVETAQIPQTQLPYGGMMPNLPTYNADPTQNMQQYGAPVAQNYPNYGANGPVAQNYPNYGANGSVNNLQNGIPDAKGEIHHFYGPNGTPMMPPLQNISQAWGGPFKQPNVPTNFVMQGTVKYGKLTSVRVEDSTVSFRDIPDFLLNEIQRMYREVPKTKIKVIASNNECNIYATPYLDALKKKEHEGYLYKPHEHYHENYHRKPMTRPVELDPYTKRYSREDVRLATERRNVVSTYNDHNSSDDEATSYPVADTDARRRWRKLKHAINVREY